MTEYRKVERVIPKNGEGCDTCYKPTKPLYHIEGISGNRCWICHCKFVDKAIANHARMEAEDNQPARQPRGY